MMPSMDDIEKQIVEAVLKSKDGRYNNTLKIHNFIEKTLAKYPCHTFSKEQSIGLSMIMAMHAQILAQGDEEEDVSNFKQTAIDVTYGQGQEVTLYYDYHIVGDVIVLRHSVKKDVCITFVEFSKEELLNTPH